MISAAHECVSVWVYATLHHTQGVSMGKNWRALEKYSSWRKISMGMWHGPGDPSIYGYETLIVDEALEYIERVSAISGVKITMLAYMVYTIAKILRENPDLNVIIVNGRVLQREHVNIFCQVALPSSSEHTQESDLSGVKLRDVDHMDLVDIAKRLRGRAKKVRTGKDKEIERQKSTINLIPRFMMRTAMKIMEFLTFNVPINFGKLGMPDDPFGSCMISSIAAFELRLGLAPLVPASRCPILFVPGAVFDDVRVVDDEIKKCKVMQVSLTCDHRAFDGLQIGVYGRSIRAFIEHPYTHFPDPETFAHHNTDAPATPPTPEERNGPRA